MRRLLVIDDHDEIRENIVEILTLAGYETYAAENGKKGVQTALKEKPDLIICDIMMPDLDGFGVLHLLRKNASTENIPFIFLTAKTERADFRKGMELGADDYLTKPFDDIELLNAIEVRLKKFDIIQGKYASDQKGVNELIRDLNTSGLLKMQLDYYETQELPRKTSLYLEGKRPKYLYYLKKGKIKAFRVHEDGKEYITNLYTIGDFIGYLPLIENKSYDDSTEVLENAEIAMIPREEFLAGIYNDLHIAGKFIRLIAQNLQEKEERLLNLAYGSLRKRVAKALVDIHAKFIKGAEAGTASERGAKEGAGISGGKPMSTTSLDISREDIAQYVGTATESLIRTLSDFKAEKLIEIRNGKIRISDITNLTNLVY
jgi:DNA-binding response OmpR family regulator